VARWALRADRVRLFRSAVLAAHPNPADPEPLRPHVDQQFTPRMFLGAPRAAEVSLWVFLSDVPAARAPMLFAPGSHLALAAAWEQRAELRGLLPRIVGVPAERLPREVAAAALEPLLARRGQVAVVSTGVLHTPSPNRDDTPRLAMTITFRAEGVDVGLPADQADAWDWSAVRRQLPPGRRHLVSRPPARL
jgi:ectoine hydroxylase-related dioxygenase (phytanoyl-CoA dioxygenase family)